MRPKVLLVGIVVTALGAVLLFLPIAPSSGGTLHTDSSIAFYSEQAGGISLIGGTMTTVSWSATENVQIFAFTQSGSGCSLANYQGPNSSGYVAPGTTVGSGSGKSGTLTFEQPEGGCMALAVDLPSNSGPVNVTYKVTTAESTYGTVVLIPGLAFVIAGVVLRRQSKEPPASSPPGEPAHVDAVRQEPES